MGQPKLGPNLNAAWLWPKGVYSLAIHDGPGPRTEDIATFLSNSGRVADFFQVACHYGGQPWADQRSAMCYQQHAVPLVQLNRLLALHQCLGNHGQDHLDTIDLNQADTIYQIGGPTNFFLSYWQSQNCPALLTFPGFQTDAQHNAWLNQDSATSGRQQGPIWADFDGDGTIQTASGPRYVGNDQECFNAGFSVQQCVDLMLGSMAQSGHGGIVNIHDFNPYAPFPMDPTDLRSAYAYDYLVGIINGCQAANHGTACVWLPPDAIPGVHRSQSLNRFVQASHAVDDFSDRTADVLVGDVNGDSFPDVIVPRKDGLYCGINAGDGTFYALSRCLKFADPSMRSTRYWVADVDRDNLPYVIWINNTGMMGVKMDGHGGFQEEARVLSGDLSQSKLRASAIYQSSIRFAAVRPGSTAPDVVAMSSSGVVTANHNGTGFDAPRLMPRVAYQAEAKPAWNPLHAGQSMLLVNLTGEGTQDLVIAGKSGLLYATATATGFSEFQPLVSQDGFDHWNDSRFYTSLNATMVGGKLAITGWTPVGVGISHLTSVDRRPAIEQFQTLCSDCFSTLPGWLEAWQKSGMTMPAFQSGFADFKGSGTPQAFAVWGKGLYVGDVSAMPGY